jgi:hypothetical protein
MIVSRGEANFFSLSLVQQDLFLSQTFLAPMIFNGASLIFLEEKNQQHQNAMSHL